MKYKSLICGKYGGYLVIQVWWYHNIIFLWNYVSIMIIRQQCFCENRFIFFLSDSRCHPTQGPSTLFLDVLCHPECSKKFTQNFFWVKQGATQCYQAFLVSTWSDWICSKGLSFLTKLLGKNVLRGPPGSFPVSPLLLPSVAPYTCTRFVWNTWGFPPHSSTVRQGPTKQTFYTHPCRKWEEKFSQH